MFGVLCCSEKLVSNPVWTTLVLLFNVYLICCFSGERSLPFGLVVVSGIDVVISSHIQIFADDYKVYRSVSTAQDIDILQRDINNLCNWFESLSM